MKVLEILRHGTNCEKLIFPLLKHRFSHQFRGRRTDYDGDSGLHDSGNALDFTGRLDRVGAVPMIVALEPARHDTDLAGDNRDRDSVSLAVIIGP